jgi:hypothetical protein
MLGFNAIEFQAFLELVDFDTLDSVSDVYPKGRRKKRHEALRNFYSRFFEYAHGKGMRVATELRTWSRSRPRSSGI